MLNRRTFIASSACSVAGAMTLSSSAFATLLRQQEGLRVQKLRDGMHAIIGGGGNSLVVTSAAGGILIDSKLPNSVFMLEERAKALLDGQPPKLLLNTHHHGDHTGGNFVFADDAKIIAHRNIKPRIEETLNGWLIPSMNRMASQLRQRGSNEEAEAMAQRATSLTVDDFAADEDYTETHTVTHGDRVLTLSHHTNAHTDNDSIIHFPNENVVHMGDLFFHAVHPYMDVSAGSNSTGWRAFVRRGIALCDNDTIVVPGHGAVTDVNGLRKQIAYFEYLEEVAQKAHRDGLERSELSGLSLGPYADYAGDRGYTNLTNVYNELASK